MKFRYPIREYMEIEDGILVVYQWSTLNDTSSPKVWENVESVDEKGMRIWTVNGMDSCPYWDRNKETFVGIRRFLDVLQLISYGGNSFDLDIKTGFVKYNSLVK